MDSDLTGCSLLSCAPFVLSIRFHLDTHPKPKLELRWHKAPEIPIIYHTVSYLDHCASNRYGVRRALARFSICKPAPPHGVGRFSTRRLDQTPDASISRHSMEKNPWKNTKDKLGGISARKNEFFAIQFSKTDPGSGVAPKITTTAGPHHCGITPSQWLLDELGTCTRTCRNYGHETTQYCFTRIRSL